jgi:hypothetical protein
MALCYNFSRVLKILGIDSFMTHLANRYPFWTLLLLNTIKAISTCPDAGIPHFRTKIRSAFRYAI